MISDIFKDSFNFSSKEPKTILELGIVYLLTALIFPIFLLYGYSYRVTNIAVNGMINREDNLPKFNHLGRMFVEGLKIFVVRFVYGLPGIIILLIFLITSFNRIFLGMSPNGPIIVISIWQIGVIALAIALWLIFYIFSIVAIPNMVNKNSLKAAFDFKKILDVIRSIGTFNYLKFYFGCIILFLGVLATTIALIGLIATISGSALMVLFSDYALWDLNLKIFFCLIAPAVIILIIVPFFMIFESRAIGMLYNMR